MTASSRRARRVAPLVLAGFLVAVLGGLVTFDRASASALDVRATRSGIAVSTACTAASVQVEPTTSGSATAVQLSGLSAADLAACAGVGAEVTLYGAAGELATATGALTSSPLTLSAAVDPAAVTRVRVLAGAFALSGTWHVPGPPANSCRVIEGDGSPTPVPCTFTGFTSPNFWGSPGWGYGQITAHFSAPDIQPTQHVEFTFTVPADLTPAWWSWTGATITGANNAAGITSRCAELPTIEGYIDANRGPTPELFVQFQQPPAASLCQP